MGFILDGLESEGYDRTYSDRALMRRIAHYFRQRVEAHAPGRYSDCGQLAVQHRAAPC